MGRGKEVTVESIHGRLEGRDACGCGEGGTRCGEISVFTRAEDRAKGEGAWGYV